MPADPKKFVTVPNVISLYRLLAAPVALWAALSSHRELFAVLIVISLLSDFVDGLIARLFDQRTEIGARLDSLADDFTQVAGIAGVLLFEWGNIRPELHWLGLYLLTYALSLGAAFLKFRRAPAYHLYLSKAAAYTVAMFFIVLFTFGYSRAFFLFTLGVGILAKLETVLVTLKLRSFETDLVSVFHLLRRDPSKGSER